MQIKQENGEKDFALVGDKSLSKTKKLLSPLYNTVEELQKELPYQISKKRLGGDGVFYLNLPVPKNELFQDPPLAQSHLSITQYYKNDKPGLKNGLSTVHYTEVYEDRQSHTRIVVHVYFTAQGHYSHTQAKQYDGNDAKGQVIELEPNQIKQLQENAKPAQKIVADLIERNCALYAKALENANRIDMELQALNGRFHKKAIERYIKKARVFIEEINTVNRFSYAAEDRRGKWMSSRVKQLRAMAEQTTVPRNNQADEESETQEFDSSSDQRSPTGTSCDKKKKKALANFQELKSLIKKITNTSAKLKKSPEVVDLNIQLNNLLEELNSKLLLLSFMTSHLNTAQKKEVEQWHSLDFLKPDLMKFFVNALMTADLAAVKALYPIMGHLLTEDKMILLLLHFARNPVEENKQNAYREVLTYLYENCSTYQFLMTSTTLFFPDKIDKENFYTLLGLTFLYENLFAYQIFLDQGMHPNTVGVLLKDVQIPLIQLICQLEVQSNRLPFLKLAMDHGGHYKAEIKLVEPGLEKARQAAGAKNSQLYFKKTIYKKELYQPQGDSQSFIQTACEEENLHYLHLFIPQMTLEDRLETFGRLMTHPDISKRTIATSVRQDYLVVNDCSDLVSAQESMLDRKFEHKLFSVLVWSKLKSTRMNLIDLLVESIKNEIQALAKDSPVKLRELQQKLLKEATPHRLQKNHNRHNLEAVLLVLILDPNPTFEKYHSLMKAYCKFAAFYKKTYPSKPHVTNHFINIAGQFLESRFSAELRQSSTYEMFVDLCEGIAPVKNIASADKTITFFKTTAQETRPSSKSSSSVVENRSIGDKVEQQGEKIPPLLDSAPQLKEETIEEKSRASSLAPMGV